MFCTEEIWLCQKHIFSHKKSFAESSLSTISRHFSVKSQLRVSTRFDEKLNKFGWHTSRKWKNTFVETNLPLFSQHVSVVASETCRGQQCRYLRSLTKLFWGLCTTILAHRKKYKCVSRSAFTPLLATKCSSESSSRFTSTTTSGPF